VVSWPFVLGEKMRKNTKKEKNQKNDVL